MGKSGINIKFQSFGAVQSVTGSNILGYPAGVALQHAALVVTQLVADHRPAPVRAPAPVQQPCDEAGLIIEANNAAYEVAEAADLAAQAAPSPGWRGSRRHKGGACGAVPGWCSSRSHTGGA